jgi:hypothetical protein
LEGARVRKEKVARNGSTKVSQNMKEVGIVDFSWTRNKLTQDTVRMRNVRTPNKMMIPSGIIERLAMSGAQVNT